VQLMAQDVCELQLDNVAPGSAPIYYRTKAILCTCGSVCTQNKTGPDNARVQAAELPVSGVHFPFRGGQWRIQQELPKSGRQLAQEPALEGLRKSHRFNDENIVVHGHTSNS
jgi:hypothetical protein